MANEIIFTEVFSISALFVTEVGNKHECKRDYMLQTFRLIINVSEFQRYECRRAILPRLPEFDTTEVVSAPPILRFPHSFSKTESSNQMSKNTKKTWTLLFSVNCSLQCLKSRL